MDACHISFLGGLCNFIVGVCCIAAVLWLIVNTNNNHGPDYSVVFWALLAVIPFLFAFAWISSQPWAYDHEACKAAIAEQKEHQIQCQQKEQTQANNEMDDLQWLRAFRIKEETREARSKCRIKS